MLKAPDADARSAPQVLSTCWASQASAFTGADFEKMHPSAVEIGGKAVDVLRARFDDSMAGKKVDRVQSVK